MLDGARLRFRLWFGGFRLGLFGDRCGGVVAGNWFIVRAACGDHKSCGGSQRERSEGDAGSCVGDFLFVVEAPVRHPCGLGWATSTTETSPKLGYAERPIDSARVRL